MLDKVLIESALPTVQKFFKCCILPELLGKWYTRINKQLVNILEAEEDDGSWCYCKSKKGRFHVIMNHVPYNGIIKNVSTYLLCQVTNSYVHCVISDT